MRNDIHHGLRNGGTLSGLKKVKEMLEGIYEPGLSEIAHRTLGQIPSPAPSQTAEAKYDNLLRLYSESEKKRKRAESAAAGYRRERDKARAEVATLTAERDAMLAHAKLREGR